MAETKRVVTTTNKALIFLVAVLSGIVALLLLSGFKKVNPYLLLAALAIASFFIYYYLKKPKVYDASRIVSDIQQKWHRNEKEMLDAADYQVIPLTPELSFVHFPKAGKTFYYDTARKIFTGVETNHVYPMIKRKEKSGLFEAVQKSSGAEAKVKAAAEALNVDLKDLGID